MDKNFKPGEVYMWEDIAKTFPNKYAIITDAVMGERNCDILKCRLWEVVSYEDRDKTIRKYYNDKRFKDTDVDYVRTTYDVTDFDYQVPSGVLIIQY